MEFGKNAMLSKGKEITLYGSPVDPNYRRVRQVLLTTGAVFSEVDVTVSAFAAEKLLRETGSASVPIVDVSGTLVKGTDEMALRSALSRLKPTI
jgi:glutathione S-transferase